MACSPDLQVNKQNGVSVGWGKRGGTAFAQGSQIPKGLQAMHLWDSHCIIIWKSYFKNCLIGIAVITKASMGVHQSDV